MPTVTYPPPWESGCGPADPGLSQINGPYSGPPAAGSGYAANRGGTGVVGTIGVGNAFAVGPQYPPAQLRFFIQGNTLYALDNRTGQTFFVSLSGVTPVPGNNTPTRSL